MTTLICPHCEAENEAGQSLCVACGGPLASEATGDTAAGIGSEPPLDKGEIDRWLRQLPEWGKSEAKSPDSDDDDDDGMPDWLQAVKAHADELTDSEADELLGFLSDLEPADSKQPDKPAASEEEVPAKMTAELPSWVAALAPEDKWPQPEADKELSQHFAEAEESDPERLPSTSQLPSTAPLEASVEMEGIPDRLASEELPEWLADQEADPAEPETNDAPVWPARRARLRTAPYAADTSDLTLPESDAEEATADTDEQLAAPDVSDSPLPGVTKESPAPADASPWPTEAESSELEQALDGLLDLPDEGPLNERVDQWLDVLEGLPEGGDPAQFEEQVRESDLDSADVPSWIEAMRPEVSGDQHKAGDLGLPEDAGEQHERLGLGPAEDSGPFAGLRGVVPAARISLGNGAGRTAAQLQLSKGQRQQAALLRQLTVVEPHSAKVEDGRESDSLLASRMILGLALLLVVLLGWLIPGAADYLPWEFEHTLPPAAEMAQDVIAVNRGRTALVAFDYTPSMAGELDSVALALLTDLAAGDSPVLTVSQVAAGVQVAEETTAAVDGLDSTALGFLPGEATGLRALGACLDQRCDTLAGRVASDELLSNLADVGLIVVLSADRDSLANWLEQVGTQNEIEIVGGVTQALGPVARAYLASEQLAGLVEGMPAAVAYGGPTVANDEATAQHLTSLTLAQWLAIGLLLGGAIYFGLMTSATSAVKQAAKK